MKKLFLITAILILSFNLIAQVHSKPKAYSFLVNHSELQPPAGDAAYWDHIRNKAFLTLVKEDTTLTGTVVKVYNEADGDLHVKMKTTTGTIDAEIICYIADKNTFCKGYKNTFTRPKIGDKITVTGDYVLDRHHKWYEIHPVKALE